jgi:tetratricopeptide (TPR) repeat protein
MRKFEKAMRNGLSAIALGALAVSGLVGVSAITAPAAVAQAKSTKEFVEAYTAAKASVDGRRYSEALPKIDAASAYAKSTQEKGAIAGMKVLCYAGLKKNSELIKAIQEHQAIGGLSGAQQTNYKQMLAGAYAATGQQAKAMELTKELIAAGGGDSTQLAYVAQAALSAKKYDEATSYANKAIEKAKAEGKKPQPAHYNILLTSYRDTAKMDQYYSTLERVAPMFNSENYWKPLIEKAKTEKTFKSADGLLDVYRALEAAKVSLTDQQRLEMGEQALTREMPIESEKILTPLVKSGFVGGPKDSKADRNKKLYATAQANAKAAKEGGLEKLETEAAAKPTGDAYAKVGEGYYTNGNYAKAIEVIQKGIDKGQMEPGALAFAQLHLGMAQLKAGKKDEARKTWSTIKADNGAGWLARTWTALSKG